MLDVKYFILLPSPPMSVRRWTISNGARCCVRQARLKCTASVTVISRRTTWSIFFCSTMNFRARWIFLERNQRIAARDLRHAHGNFRNAAEQHLGHLRAELAYADVQQIIAKGLHDSLQSDSIAWITLFSRRSLHCARMASHEAAFRGTRRMTFCLGIKVEEG